jgi:uncharacterized hydrophobic protein (TIGR00341 family)
MKKVIISTKSEEAANIPPLLKDLYFTREEIGPITQFTTIVAENDLDNLVSDIQQALKFMDDSSVVEVYSPDFIIFPKLEKEIAERKEKEGKEPGTKKKEHSPVEKLVNSAGTHIDLDANIIILTAIASFVGLIGLFINNVGIIIGAMLISPLLGPIYAFAISTAVGQGKNVLLCVRTILALTLIIVIIGIIFTFAVSFFIQLPITSEILSRMVSSPVYIVMAIFLGFASIVALSEGIPEGVAGVAVAAALLPPALVTGIAVILYQQGVVAAFTLTMQNVIGLMAGSIIGALALQVEPRSYSERLGAKAIVKRIIWLLIVLVLLLFFVSLLPSFISLLPPV